MMTRDIEEVVLVDRADQRIGVAEKLTAHRTASLHRAFSIFVFNSAGSVLLQRRAYTKYHLAGLWSNTCCSHPRPDEATNAAALRRLQEEMGFACPLESAFAFIYRADVGGGLIEHEYDHVFIGRYDALPCPDPREVAEWKWMNARQLSAELASNPGAYTFWLHVAWRELGVHLGGWDVDSRARRDDSGDDRHQSEGRRDG